MSDQDQRIGDSERDEATARLAEHFAAGRLTRFELDERTEQALSARTRGELDRLMIDLPPASAEALPTETVETTTGLTVATQQTPAAWRRAMLAPWAVFGVFFIILWAATGAGYFWPIWPIMGWGIGVAVTGISAYNSPNALKRGRRP